MDKFYETRLKLSFELLSQYSSQALREVVLSHLSVILLADYSNINFKLEVNRRHLIRDLTKKGRRKIIWDIAQAIARGRVAKEIILTNLERIEGNRPWTGKCEFCGANNQILVDHHWFEPPSMIEKHANICESCNVKLSTPVGEGNHVLPKKAKQIKWVKSNSFKRFCL